MLNRNTMRSRFGLLVAVASALALDPALAHSGTLFNRDHRVGGAAVGASLDHPTPVAWSVFRHVPATGVRTEAAIAGLDRDGSIELAQGSGSTMNRIWSRTAVVNRSNLFPGWVRPGWGARRPWDHGWYSAGVFKRWRWWESGSRRWGVNTLALRTSINNAVDNAINDYIPYIVVSEANYKLFYGTEKPYGSDSLSFLVQSNKTDYTLDANCKQGTINGQDPTNLAEAELLNAACQVAYGSV